ncbi:hypothetical protein ES705_05744 [subsurface metagenome]
MEKSFYTADEERWKEEFELRKKAAEYLKVPNGAKVLEILVGEADYGRIVAKYYNVEVISIEINENDIKNAKIKIKKDGLTNNVTILKRDVVGNKFPDNSFDYIINFIGWTDVTAYYGRQVVEKVIKETLRVLKENGTISISFTPKIAPVDDISRKDIELQNFMWVSEQRPEHFDEEFFIELLKKHHVKIVKKHIITAKKSRINPKDAKGGIEWESLHCNDWYPPDVKFRAPEEIFKKFSKHINKYGVPSHMNKIVLLIGNKM